MTKVNPFEQCPAYTTSNFQLRKTIPEDAPDLLLCYSDKEAVKLFNSDNCHTDFYFQTLPVMQEYMEVWEREYQEKVYVRFSVLDKASQKAIGTIEFCPRNKKTNGYGKLAVLRIDLASHYETEIILTELLNTINEYFYELFQVDRVITKAVPEAKGRISALISGGYNKVDEGIVPFGDYYIR